MWPNIAGTDSASIPALLVAMATFKPMLEAADSFCAFQETSRKNILQGRWGGSPIYSARIVDLAEASADQIHVYKTPLF